MATEENNISEGSADSDGMNGVSPLESANTNAVASEKSGAEDVEMRDVPNTLPTLPPPPPSSGPIFLPSALSGMRSFPASPLSKQKPVIPPNFLAHFSAATPSSSNGPHRSAENGPPPRQFAGASFPIPSNCPQERLPESKQVPAKAEKKEIVTESGKGVDMDTFIPEWYKIVKALKKDSLSFYFRDPVDPVELEIPDYPEIVKHPMDLGTVESRLESGYYICNDQSFIRDVRLIWSNAMLYNEEGSEVYEYASRLSSVFEKKLLAVLKKFEVSENVLPALPDEIALAQSATVGDESKEGSRKERNRRASTRLRTREKITYTEEYDSDSFDKIMASEDQSKDEDEFPPPDYVTQMILTHRLSDNDPENPDHNPPDTRKYYAGKDVPSPPEGKHYEYRVKMKGLSYLHLQWVTLIQFLAEGKGGRQKLSRYWRKCKDEEAKREEDGLPPPKYPEDDKDTFPLENVEIERILAMRAVEVKPSGKKKILSGAGETVLSDILEEEKPVKEKKQYTPKKKKKEKVNSDFDDGETMRTRPIKIRKGIISIPVRLPKKSSSSSSVVNKAPSESKSSIPHIVHKEVQYLVKWCGLPYSESTWETMEDINDDDQITQFKRISEICVPSTAPLRPPPGDYKPLSSKPTFNGDRELRSYQLEGLEWLVFNWFQRRGCILADEMGLGKTIQSISFMEYLRRYAGVQGPFLVVVPLSTIQQWKREVSEWTDMNAVVFWGNEVDRQIIRKYEMYSRFSTPTRESYKFHVMITTYEIMMRGDANEISRIGWRCLIVDEAHRLKNNVSKLLERLNLLKADHKILLTGTPLQNNLQELWNLLNFAAPFDFPDEQSFKAEYGDLSNFDQVQTLQGILRPYLLRRLKEDVEKSIPPKEEVLVELEMTDMQKQYYKALLDKNRQFLCRGAKAQNSPNLMNVFMQLRKVCNHPFLMTGVEDRETANVPAEEYINALVMASSKFQFLDKLLPKLKAQGHRVLIFSQMVRLLDILETYFRAREWLFERLDGGIRGNERQASIDRYNAPNSDRFIFMLCTRAGGVGINLTSADTVIIFDSDWNPQNDIQAQARCHRIGQESDVKVYRLMCSKTYENQMFQLASKKLGLDQAVLNNMDKGSGGVSSSSKVQLAKEVDTLLKHGAYELFQEGSQSSSKTSLLRDEDIDSILERTARVVKYGGKEENTEQAPSTFSKAVFQPLDACGIDINDPNFWDKVNDEGSIHTLTQPHVLASFIPFFLPLLKNVSSAFCQMTGFRFCRMSAARRRC